MTGSTPLAAWYDVHMMKVQSVVILMVIRILWRLKFWSNQSQRVRGMVLARMPNAMQGASNLKAQHPSMNGVNPMKQEAMRAG